MIVPQAGMIPHRKGLPGTGSLNGDAKCAHQCPIPRKKKRETPNGASRPVSLLIDEMPTAVLLPASFVAFGAEGLFLAVADGLDPAGVHARRGQRVLHRAGALVAQSQVVLGRATLVAVSFNREIHIAVLTQELRVRLDRGLRSEEHRV